MNGYSKRIAIIGGALALAGLMGGGAALAQGTAQNMPEPQVSTETCAQVDWAPQLLAQYPQIADACQEVVTVNGENWARIEGRLISVNADGRVTSMVLDRDGKRMGRMTLKPAADQKVLLEGHEYTFNQLQPGAMLHLYIPEHMYAVATEPSEPSEMAVIEPEPAAQVAELPQTAGPLPWVLVAGGALLLAGLGLGLWRRFGS